MTLKRSVIVSFVCALLGVALLAFGVVRYYCHILISDYQSSDPELMVYQVDEERRLLVGRDVAFLINTREQVVLTMSVVGRKFGSLLLWPRDSIQGVPLGDPVKGNIDDRYQFSDRGVEVVYWTRTGKNAVHVSL